MYQYKFPMFSLTVDCVVFGIDEEDLKILLIQRALEPNKGDWALPGGFVHIDETIDCAAMRELKEETSIDNVFLEQLYTFGAVDRDPRERIVSVAYLGLVNIREHKIKAATDAKNAKWFSIKELPKLAFDHAEIVNTAIKRLRGKIRYQPIGFNLLPQKFTLHQLQHLYEVILSRSLDKRNFRRKILGMGFIKSTGEKEVNVTHRAAQFYSFDEKGYNRLLESGFEDDII
jgi:8-oxo-dGTP diphosphatase